MTRIRVAAGGLAHAASARAGLVLVVLALAACGSGATPTTAARDSAGPSARASSPSSADSDLSGTVTVLAAASLTEPFTTLADSFEAAHPGVTVRLSFGSSTTLAQQVGFEREMDHLIHVAQERGVASDPVMRQRLVSACIGLQLMKWNGLRSMGSGVPGPEASISKLFWGQWHSDLGELAMDVLGMDSLIAEGFPYELTLDQKLFLFTRSETIYGGSNEIQRNVLGERVLGLPKEPNPS